jgi:5S rRNA maturation endonuclease (ribonuclease M5)
MQKNSRVIVKEYDYQDEEGQLVFQVVRFHPKEFRQRQPNGKGGWIWNLKGVHPVPYRLPQVLQADTVFIVEGEEDADRLQELGLVASCNPMGAGKWRAEYNPHFRGKKVIILPDNDEPGRKHAQDVARKLHGVAASVKVVELPSLPEKGDVSDWLKAGGTMEQLQALAGEAPEFDPATAPQGEKLGGEAKKEKPTQAEIMQTLAADAELFHTPAHECFARITINGHKEVWPIRSGGFRRWLLQKFYEAERKPPQSEALQAVVGVLEARAQFDGPERPVWVRVAEHEGNIYLDLGNSAWDAVEITPHGWQVIAEAPVCFRRSGSMAALPYPERGGSVNELRPFLNVGSDSDFILMVASILAAMRPCGPYPITVLNGEQGAAKSTAARAMGSLSDPNISPLRSVPREERDLAVYAYNSWTLGFDNLSGIRKWLSDAFCRLSTGGGVSNRELYTNRDENILDAMRPIILNGIDSLTERSDLADRALIFNLKQIPDKSRQSEKQFWAKFNQAQPRILGALLDAVSAGVKNLESVNLPALPRMADFALWITAAEPALPWPAGSFLATYTGNRQEAIELSLEADVVAVAVRAHMTDRDEWTGTAKELYEALENHVAESTRKSKSWPKAPHWLSNRLRRAATFLRKVGINIEFCHSGDRKIIITHNYIQNSDQSDQCAQSQGNQRVSPDAPNNNSVNPEPNSVQTGNGDGISDASFDGKDASKKVASAQDADNHASRDGKDASDAPLHTSPEDFVEIDL